MQAITTRYLAPTNTKPARIVAECAARRMVVSVPVDAQSTDEEHVHAVSTLLRALNWTSANGYHFKWVAGGTHNGATVWVATDNDALSVLVH